MSPEILSLKNFMCVYCMYCICGIGWVSALSLVSYSISSATYSCMCEQRGTITARQLGLQMLYQLYKQRRLRWLHANVTRKERAWPTDHNSSMNNVLFSVRELLFRKKHAYNKKDNKAEPSPWFKMCQKQCRVLTSVLYRCFIK